jgi:hypothetical protein
VGSDLGEIVQKTIQISLEKAVGIKEVQVNQLQFKGLQINQELRRIFIRRIKDKYAIKWLHMTTEDSDYIKTTQDYLEKISQLLILREVLYRSNFNIIEFSKTREA